MWYKIVLILIILILFFVAVMVIDNHRFVVRRYTLRSKRVRNPVRLVFIADLHEKSYGKENEALVEAIKALKPDAVLVGGDLIVSGRVKREAEKNAESGKSGPTDTDWMKHSLSFVKELAKISQVWFVPGNHEIRLSYYEDYRSYDRLFREEMQKAGVQFLHNKDAADLCAKENSGADTGVRLRALTLPMRFYRKFTKTVLTQEELKQMLGEADPAAYTVLLTHTPVYFEQYAEWGADLCLCGHVHGGLMRLPLIGGVMGTRPNLFPKYSGGQYSYPKGGGSGDDSTLIVTCGLGMHTLPIRIFNPGEISYVELQPEEP